MSSEPKPPEANALDSFFVNGESSTLKKDKRRKKCILKNANKPNFRPFEPPECTDEEIQVTKVLGYSECDFPLLGCASKKIKSEVAENQETSTSNSMPVEETLPKKVLRSNKHKEAFRVNLEEIFSNVSDKPTKHKIKSARHFKEEVALCGNPLDSDNPIRKKGVVSTKPKLKRMSKTKAMVYAAREEMQRLKAISERISVEDGLIRAGCETSVDEIWKPLCFFKAKDVKQCLQKEEFRDYELQESDDELSNPDQNTNESVHSSESESSLRCVLPLQEALEKSEIPPYKLLIHTNNFKRYCDNCVTSELDKIAEKLISQLVRFQYKKYQVDPLKAAAKKRYVIGLRQVKKYTKMNKTKLIVFVPNMEESLHEIVEELKSLAVAYCIPYMFGFTRKKLGKMAYKKIGVSCLGILDYSGADEHFKNCMESLTRAKKLYNVQSSKAKDHYEEYFNKTSSTDELTRDITEEIRQDFIYKLSMYDGNNELDNNPDDNSESSAV